MDMDTNVSDTIERSVLIAASAEQVWEVVSIPGWWVNDGSGLELSLIERVTEDRVIVHHPTYGEIAVERLESDPPRRAAFRWAVSGAEGRDVDVSDDQLLHTRVVLTLTPQNGGTLLSVTESGFATAAVSEQARRRAYEGNTEGWEIELGLARAHVEQE